MTILATNRKRVARLVYSNIDNLFVCAEKFAKNERFGPASHLMLSAREECIKWMLLHCWDHIDEAIKKKVYRHEFKHEAVIVFYTLFVQLAVLNVSEMVTTSIGRRNTRIYDHAQLINFANSKIFSVTDPEQLAQRINDIFIAGDRQDHEIELIAVLGKDEVNRQRSIYVDFDQSLKESGGPHRFKKRDYDLYKSDVQLARYYVDRCAGMKPSVRSIYLLFPAFRRLLAQKRCSYFEVVEKELRTAK